MLIVNELLEKIEVEPIFVLQGPAGFRKLLAPTPEMQHKTLKVLLKNALLFFEKWDLWDQLRLVPFNANFYEFKEIIGANDTDTFGIPEQIAYVKTGTGLLGNVNPWVVASAEQQLNSDYGTSFSARLWQYSKPILKAQYNGTLLARCLTHRPFIFTDTADHQFGNDSKIFGIDIQNLNFYNVVLRDILTHIKTVKESVTMTQSVQFLGNLDSEINRLNNMIDTYIRTNAKGMNLWRK